MALCKSHTMANARGSFRIAKNNRSKSVWTLFQRKRLNNQTVWPVIFGLTGPICARAPKSFHPLELRPRGHHDWPVSAVKLVDDLAGGVPPVQITSWHCSD